MNFTHRMTPIVKTILLFQMMDAFVRLERKNRKRNENREERPLPTNYGTIMYKPQEHADGPVLLNGNYVTPLATLKDENGGISHIIEDDHCFVLINGSYKRPFKMATHWYKEAAQVLAILIDDRDYLED